eukprot:scaffold30334_cov19-Tisochrysis_lutea.AAC.2
MAGKDCKMKGYKTIETEGEKTIEAQKDRGGDTGPAVIRACGDQGLPSGPVVIRACGAMPGPGLTMDGYGETHASLLVWEHYPMQRSPMHGSLLT